MRLPENVDKLNPTAYGVYKPGSDHHKGNLVAIILEIGGRFHTVVYYRDKQYKDFDFWSLRSAIRNVRNRASGLDIWE